MYAFRPLTGISLVDLLFSYESKSRSKHLEFRIYLKHRRKVIYL